PAFETQTVDSFVAGIDPPDNQLIASLRQHRQDTRVGPASTVVIGSIEPLTTQFQYGIELRSAHHQFVQAFLCDLQTVLVAIVHTAGLQLSKDLGTQLQLTLVDEFTSFQFDTERPEITGTFATDRKVVHTILFRL